MTITLDRGIDATSNAAAKSSALIAVPILFLDFRAPTMAKYFAGANVNIIIANSDVMPAGTYLGVAGVSSISTTEESLEVKSTAITAELNGIDSTYIALVLAEQYFGRDAYYGIVLLDSDYLPVGDPILLFKGFISVLNTEIQEQAKVTVEIESIFTDWERPRVLRYNTKSQSLIDGNDSGFNNVGPIVNKEVTWG
jgi:hypothetical protein